MINSLKQNMNYLTLKQAANIAYGGFMEAVPLYDRESEIAQEIHDRAEKLWDGEKNDLMKDHGMVLEAIGEIQPEKLFAIMAQDPMLRAEMMKYIGKIAWENALDKAEKER